MACTNSCRVSQTAFRARFEAGALLFACCLALLALVRPRAHACTLVPIAAYAAAQRVPLSGPVLVDVRCETGDFCLTATPGLIVRDGAAAVAGRVELVRGSERDLFVAFFPTMPLRDGAAYEVEVALGDEVDRAFLPVTADATASYGARELASFASELTTLDVPSGQRVCCQGGASCFPACFHEAAVVGATLKPRLEDPSATSAEVPDAAYIYRLRYKDGETERETPWSRASEPPTASFARAAERFCAVLERRSLLDGQVAQRELCHNAEAGVSYGAAREPVWNTLSFAVGDCPVPPGVDISCDPFSGKCPAPSRKLLSAWCEVQTEECNNATEASIQCIAVAFYCEEVGIMPALDAGVPDAAVGTVVDASGVDAATDDAGVRSKDNGGCSASEGRGSAGGTLLFFGLLTFLLRRRRSAMRLTSSVSRRRRR